MFVKLSDIMSLFLHALTAFHFNLLPILKTVVKSQLTDCCIYIVAQCMHANLSILALNPKQGLKKQYA